MKNEYFPAHIMNHYRNPKNAGFIKGADIKAQEYNSHCGDETKIFIKLKNDKIVDCRHETVGCTLCVAGASILSEKAVGKKFNELTNLEEDKFLKEFKTEIGTSRKNCALLALRAIKKS